jgi:hypothetical protein
MEKSRRNSELSEVITQYGFHHRAREVDEQHRRLVLARFRVNYHRPGSARGRIAVNKGERGFVVMSKTRAPEALSPGSYNVANLLGSSDPESTTPVAYVTCITNDLPIDATVVLPDLKFMEENMGTTGDARIDLIAPDQALKSLSLRTADNVLGGARLQISLRLENPMEFIKRFGDERIDGELNSGRGLRYTETVVEKEPVGWFRETCRKINRALHGEGPPAQEVEVEFKVRPELTFAEIYPLIRLELATALRGSIHDKTLEQLYDTWEIRESVEADVQRALDRTLRGFGLRIERISMFQFLSPAYEELLERRGQIGLRKEALQDHRVAAELAAEERKIQLGDRVHEAESEGALRRKELEEEGKTQQVEDQNQAEHDRRMRLYEEETRAYQREQLELDERLRLQLEKEREQQEIELQRLTQQEALKLWKEREEIKLELEDKRIALQGRRIEQYKLLEPDQLFHVLMAENPHMVQAFVAMHQARNADERVNAERGYRLELEKAYGQHSDHMSQVIITAAGQLGRIMGSAIGASRPGHERRLEHDRDLDNA